MALLPWPSAAWQLGALIVLAAPGDRDPLVARHRDALRRRRAPRDRAGDRVRARQRRVGVRADRGLRRQRPARRRDERPRAVPAARRGLGGDLHRPPARSIACPPQWRPRSSTARRSRRRSARRSARTSRRGSSRAARKPGLATVLVGDDPASAVYIGGKQKASAEAGIEGFDHRLLPRREPRRGRAPAPAPQRRPGRLGHPAPAPDPAAGRRRRADRADRPGQGRRRPHADLRRPARQGPARACARARRPA